MQQEVLRYQMHINSHFKIGSAGRSERIRTYNFAQGRVTDHRCNFTKHDIESVMNGECLEEFQAAMKQELILQAIKELNSSS